MQQTYDYLYKVILIGDSAVGKSSILCQYADKEFSDSHISTIGVDFKIATIKVGSKKVKLQIWDTAGQERFKTIINSFFRGIQGVFLVFDITNKSTFDNLSYWEGELNRFYPGESLSKKTIFVIGNKIDLEEKRSVSYDEANEYAKSIGARYFETSAKENIRISDIFYNLAYSALNDKDRLDLLNSPSVGKVVIVGGKSINKCC
jgi:Ras-related protein Rab-1A